MLEKLKKDHFSNEYKKPPYVILFLLQNLKIYSHHLKKRSMILKIWEVEEVKEMEMKKKSMILKIKQLEEVKEMEKRKKRNMTSFIII